MEVIFAIITHISVNTVKVRTSRSYVHFSTYNHSVCFFTSQLERKRNFYSFPPRYRPRSTSLSNVIKPEKETQHRHDLVTSVAFN